MTKLTDLKNRTFGFLTVTDFSHYHTQPGGAKVAYWNVICVCGKKFKRRSTHLLTPKKLGQSCGCKAKEQCGDRFRTHGLKKYRAYTSWQNMHRRCYDKTDRDYHNYGARGITVCERWFSPENFFEDMGERKAGQSLERVDVNKNYYKENCRWATAKEQANNKRNNRWITFNGQTETLTNWAKIIGIKPSTLHFRFANKWTLIEALTTPRTKEKRKAI